MNNLFILLLVLCSSCLQAETISLVAEELTPFHFESADGEPQGALFEIAQAVIDETDFSASFNFYSHARAYDLALNNRNTFIISLLKSPHRAPKFKWAGQVYKSKAFLIGLARRADLKLNSLVDAQRYRVATIRGYHSESYLKQRGFSEKNNLVLSVKSEHMWGMLFKGRIDLILTNYLALESEVKSAGFNPEKLKQYIELEDFPIELHMATSLSTSDEVVRQLLEGLNTLKQKGTYSKIMQKWELD